MQAEWTVQLSDGNHRIYAELIRSLPTARLKLTWDGAVIDSGYVWWTIGDIRSFQRNGHAFVLSVHGFGLLGSLALSMDGLKMSATGDAPVAAESAPVVTPPAPQLIEDLDAQETEEVVASEHYPLDNRFGDQPITAVRQVSRESTNELSIEDSSQLSGSLGITALSVIKAEIAAQLSRQIGSKIGETVTESQTLTFSVGAKAAVMYEVLWKRKVRAGQRVYSLGATTVAVPYRINYGLSCEVRTVAWTDAHEPAQPREVSR